MNDTATKQRLTPAGFNTTYWSVTGGDEFFPVVIGAQYGVRLDVPERTEWKGGRVYTSREGAQAWLTYCRQALIHSNREGRLGVMSLEDFDGSFRVQAIVRPEGTPAHVWFPAA